MLTAFIVLLSLECVVIFVWALAQRERVIQYPFLATAVFVGWVLPQIIGLSVYNNIPGSGLEKTTIMAILCLGAIWLGYNWNPAPTGLLWWRLDRRRLVIGSVALCAIGGYFAYRVSLLAATATADTGGQWTGIITIYEFFSHLIAVGMAIALVVHLKRPSWSTLIILLLCGAFYADRIIIKGRRAAMVEIAVYAIMALRFQRQFVPPRTLVVLVCVASALLVNSIGEYRGVMLGEDRTTWSGAGIGDIFKIDFIGNFSRNLTGERGNFEVTNAAMNIEATSRLSHYDFGLSLWNGIVDRFVPGQWIGSDVKQAMKADIDDPAYSMFRYQPMVGSTNTGLTDTFASFWYFGALEFLAVGLFMGAWYRAAAGGNIAAQIVIMLTMTGALESITHSMEEFVSGVFVLCLFLLPVFVYARVAAPGYRGLAASRPG